MRAIDSQGGEILWVSKLISFCSIVLLFSALPCAAENKEKPALNSSERALYEVLRATPHYNYGEVLLELTLGGKAEFGIGSELTPDSLDKLASYLPELPAVIEAGKQFRIDHLNHLAVRGEASLFEGTGIDRNPSARLLRTYNQMVRAYNRKKELPPTERQVAPIAFETVRQRYAYPLNRPRTEWPLEHQREYHDEIEKLIRITTRATPTRELPENILEGWRKAELKRLQAQREKIREYFKLLDSTRKLPGLQSQIAAYQDKLLENTSLSVESAESTLKKILDQDKLVESLEKQQVAADAGSRRVKGLYFGDNEDRRGGAFSRLQNPDWGWVQDILWWGLGDRGKSDPAEELSSYWVERAEKSRRWLGLFPLLRNSSIEKIADPVSYKAKMKHLWQERLEKTKQLIGKGARAAVILGLVVGAEEGIRHYAWPATQGVLAYLNQPSDQSATEPMDRPESGERQSLMDEINEKLSPLKYLSKARPAGQENGGGLPGLADESRPSSASPLAEGESSTRLFKITPATWAGGESGIPTEFEFANSADRNGAKEQTEKPGGQAVFSIETSVPQKVDWQYVSLLGAAGFVPQVEVYLDGEQIPNDQFKLMHQPRSGAYYLELPHGKTVSWRATYYRADEKVAQRKIVPPNRLPDIPAHQAAWLIVLQKEANQEKQAEDLEKRLADSIQRGTPIRPEHLDEGIRRLTRYSTETAKEGSYDPLNPLNRFLPYQKGDTTCFDCDGARNLEDSYLEIAWEGVPGVHTDRRMLYTREPGSLEITVDKGHARLAVFTDNFKPEEVVIFDPTPITKAEGSREEPPKYPRSLSTPEPEKEKSLKELSRATGWGEEAEEKKNSDPLSQRSPIPEPVRGFPRVDWALPTRRPVPPREELGEPRHRTYGQYPPLKKPAIETAPETLASVEARENPKKEVAAPQTAPQTRDSIVPSVARKPPPPPEPPRELSPEEETRVLVEARREQEARIARNRRRRSALTTTRALSANLASAAEAVYLSPSDPLAPHNWSRRLVSRIGAYLSGETADLTALREELRKANVNVPEELSSESDLRELVAKAALQFEKARQNRQRLDEKATERRAINTRGKNYTDDLVSRANALLDALREAPLSPIETEDFQRIHREIRASFIQNRSAAPAQRKCAGALGKLS